MAFAKITLIGAMDYFEQQNMSLFDYLELPAGLDKEVLIDDLVYRACDFELLHINPDYTRYAIGAFSNKWQDTWQHWYDALNTEYNPLYNYDRYEVGTDKHTGTQGTVGTNGYTKGNTGTQTVANTGTQKNENTGTQTRDNTGYTETKDTGTQTIDNTGTQTIDNTGTQTNTNTGTETTAHTGTVTNVEDRDQSYSDTANHTGTDDMHVIFGKTTDRNFSETTTTTNEVAAFNSSTWSDHTKSTAVTNHNTDHTVEGGTEDHNETKNLTDTDNGSVNEDNTLTRTDDLVDLRTDDLTARRVDDLSQERTDDLTQERTDNLSSKRTDNLSETRTDNLTATRTDNLNQLRTDALTESLSGNDSSTRTDNLTDTRDMHMYGNIGVTTSQQMLEAELNIRKWNIYEKIADMFISEFCIMIY